MKKAILFLVLGLFWCNVGFAEVINFSCKLEKFNYSWSLDLDREIIKGSQLYDGQREYHDYVTKFIDKEKAVIENYQFENTFTWYYATDQRVITKGTKGSTNWKCNYDRSRLAKAVQAKFKPAEPAKPKFASKEKQYEHTCGKALGLKKGSKPYMECALKIMEMELELTRINAQKEVALAQAQAADAQQRSADAQMLQAEAYAQDRKFNQGLDQLMLGLSLLGGGSTSSTPSPSMDSFNCRVRGTGSMQYVDCW